MSLKPRRFRLAAAPLACVLSSLSYGQGGRASITGVVTDHTGAVVPNASVVATNTLTGQVTRATTASNGTFVVPLLPVGNYSLTVEQAGFRAATRNGIVLTPDQIATVDITLELGQVNQAVEVSANAEMLQTTTAAMGQVVSEKSIVELPLNGRNPATLVLLSPGVVNILGTAGGTNAGHVSSPNDTGASGNGGRQGSVLYLLDGAYHNDVENGLSSPMPNPDATQEFRVISNNFDAQYGFAPSSVVSVVTRSGTNQWHGDAFEFLRNYDLNAANWFTHAKDTLKRNQTGGSIGGPIKKDKLFIFGNYQYTGENSMLTGRTAYVPNAKQLNGDFSDLYTGRTTNACGAGGPSNMNFDTGQIFQVTAAQPFGSSYVCPASSAKAGQTVMVKQPYVGNQINPATFNPVATRIEQSLPVSAAANGFTYIPAVPQIDYTHEFTIKADYNLNERHRISGRVFYQDYNYPKNDGNGNLLQSQSSWDVLVASYSGNYTWTARPNLINNFVADINYTHDTSYPGMMGADGKPISYQLYGSKVNYPPAGTYPPSLDGLSLSNYFSVGQNTNAPMFRRSMAFSDSVTWTKDKHMIVAGLNVLREDYTDSTDWQASPRMMFNGSVSGNSVADFLLGNLYQYEQGSGEFTQNYGTSLAPFIQDTWRMKPNFTLTLGLRWEPYLPPTIVGGRADSWRPGEQSQRYPNAPLGLVFPGDPGVSAATVDNGLDKFSPRVGLAWQPHFLPNTSIRAAFGMFVAPISNMNYHHISGSAPFSPLYDLYYNQLGVINMSDPWASFAGTNYTTPFPPFATLGTIPPSTAPFVRGSTIYEVLAPNFTLPTTQSWNLSIQHEFTSNNLLTVAYVGSETMHSYVPVQLNPGFYSAKSARLLYPELGSILEEESVANSPYESLQISFEHRFSHGLQVTSNYTFSKCIDLRSMGDAAYAGSIGDPFNLNWNRSVCDMNIPHVWITNWVWQSPSLKKAGKLVNTVAGDWQISGIYTIQSGLPFSVAGGCNGSNNSGALIGADRADWAGQPLNVHQGSEGQWIAHYFNPAAFVCNAPGTFGTSGRNIMYGPGTNNADLGISKNFPFKERYRAQFRWEMFNAFNRPWFANPGTSPVGGGYSQIIGQRNAPRIMQGALKFYF